MTIHGTRRTIHGGKRHVMGSGGPLARLGSPRPARPGHRLKRLGLDQLKPKERQAELQRRIAAHSKKVDELEARRKGRLPDETHKRNTWVV